MAARKNPFQDAETRKKIQTTQLIKRLTSHAVSDEEIMTASQVTAALGLLKKSVPDLKAVELSGNADNPLVIVKDLSGQ